MTVPAIGCQCHPALEDRATFLAKIRSGTRPVSIVRARVRAKTGPLPACRRVLAHSRSVVAVVKDIIYEEDAFSPEILRPVDGIGACI